MRNPLGPKRHVKKGWHVQGIKLGPGKSYVKIFDPFGNCVDTALSLTKARQRAKKYAEAPLFSHPGNNVFPNEHLTKRNKSAILEG